MKPNGNALTLTAGRRENTHFQKPLSNGTLVPKLLNIFGRSFTVPHGTLYTPARISCAMCFNSDWNSGFTSQVWTEGLHIKNCGGKGCIYTRSATRSIRGQYEASLYGLSTSSPWASEARLPHLSWHLLWKQWATKTWEDLSYWYSFSQRNSG